MLQLNSLMVVLVVSLVVTPLDAQSCYRFMDERGFAAPCGFSGDHPCRALADILAQACQDTVVVIGGGKYTGIGNRDLTIQLHGEETLQLVANGTVIFDGEYKSRILSVVSGSVVLNDINFVNGFVDPTNSSRGGCIEFQSSLRPQEHEMKGCEFHHCTAHMGGAIYVGKFNLLNITHCNFFNSNATVGGAIYMNSEVLNLRSSMFLLNQATNGGAIQISDTDNVLLTVSNTTFSNNTASFIGGALSMNVTNITITAHNIQLLENTAQMGGAWSCFSTYPSNSSFSSINWTDNTASQPCYSEIFGNCTSLFGDSCILRAVINNCSDCPDSQCSSSKGTTHCFGANKATQDCLCIVHQPLNLIIIAAIAGSTVFLLLVFFISCRLNLCSRLSSYTTIQ